MIRDAKIKETVGAYYKRAWDEQVAPRYRSDEPAPGMSQRFLRLLDAAEYLPAHSRGPRLDRPLPGRRHPDPHVRLVYLSSGSEYVARGKSTRPRRDSDDAVLAVRERSGGCIRVAAERPLLCSAADWLPHGRFGPVRRIALADVVYEDQWASVPRLGSGKASHSWISGLLYVGAALTGTRPSQREGANRPRPSGAFVARSFPSDTSMEMPYRPAPEQSHAE